MWRCVSVLSPRFERYSEVFRHFWWNGGYFGCIHQVRAILPKPKVGGLSIPFAIRGKFDGLDSWYRITRRV